MSMYAFIELPSPLDTWVTTPDVLFPMRSQLAAKLQSSDAPDPEQILLELERYVDENPDKLSRFSEAGGQLAFRTAVELSINGLKEEALPFYELSLRLRPGDVITRLNYAIALHELAYRAEALEQYNLLMKQTSPGEHLRVWILAAQIHFYHGEYAQVVRLLEPLAETYFPDDAQFWELLGEASAQALSASEALPMVSAAGAGMGDFDFYELKPELRGQWHLPPTPIPVRRERQHEVFPQGGPVDIRAMLEEMRVFLEQHPALNDLYNPLIALLAYLAGMNAATDGRHEQALQIYELGLAAEPGSIGLRSHYALALHSLGRDDEAKSWMEQIVADTPQGTILPMLWVLLARLYAHDGEHAKALALLEALDQVAHDEKGLQAFLADMRQKIATPAQVTAVPLPEPMVPAPEKSRTLVYATAAALFAVLLGGAAYWGWSAKRAAEEQAAVTAENSARIEAHWQAAEQEKRAAEAERLRLQAESDEIAAAAKHVTAEKNTQSEQEKPRLEQKTDANQATATANAGPASPSVQVRQVKKEAPVARRKHDTTTPVAAATQKADPKQDNPQLPVQPDTQAPANTGKVYTAKFKGALGIVVAKRDYPTKEMKQRALKLWAENRSILEPDGTITKPASSTSNEAPRIPGH